MCLNKCVLFFSCVVSLISSAALRAQTAPTQNEPATATSRAEEPNSPTDPLVVPAFADDVSTTSESTNSDANSVVQVGYESGSQEPVLPSPTMDQIPSARPAPFQITPETQPAGMSQNTYSGNPPVQDLSRLLAGKFINTKYKWYGFVRLDGIFDFNPIGSTDDFVTSSIPVPHGRGQNAVLTPRYTRLGFDTETPWEAMDWTIKTRIEVDFFNGNTSGAFGSFPLRLRFAWADFGPFLIGQAASLFMDYDVFPDVIDYEGPPGMVLMRQPIAAVRFPICDNLKVSLGVEQPYSDIQWLEEGGWVVNPGSGIITTKGVDRNIQDMPDFTGNIRYEYDYGHVQVAGIARKLTFQPASGPDESEFGYGINVTGSWHPWAHINGCAMGDDKTPTEKCEFVAQYAAGKGINRYIQDINGFGLDATFDPVHGFRALSSNGWFVAYEQWWCKNWISVFSYGEANTDLTNTLPDNTYDSATYATANLIWLPVERMGVGIEYLYGTRTDKNGQSGTAHRIQVGFQYRF
jgi:DcaP outer membrane protein